jgi:hypothetical protein
MEPSRTRRTVADRCREVWQLALDLLPAGRRRPALLPLPVREQQGDTRRDR